jgi:hypothetical protein
MMSRVGGGMSVFPHASAPRFEIHSPDSEGIVMDWYMKALKKYAEFSGRAQRSEYWYFTLFNILISLGLSARKCRS